MAQLTFADFVISRNNKWLSGHAGKLQDEADAEGAPYDYEDYDYTATGVEEDNDSAVLDWS